MKENKQTDKEVVKKALYKKAVGYDSEETVEEYSDSDGDLVLVKRKVTTKPVPPDITAIKLVLGLDGGEEDLSALSDEELEKRKKKLIKIIKEKLNDGNNEKNRP